MGELGARQLCSFDPASAELYASVSSDNRLRIWNTVRPHNYRLPCGPCVALRVTRWLVFDAVGAPRS